MSVRNRTEIPKGTMTPPASGGATTLTADSPARKSPRSTTPFGPYWPKVEVRAAMLSVCFSEEKRLSFIAVTLTSATAIQPPRCNF